MKSSFLKRRLPANVFKIVRKIGNLAEDNGMSAYLVGGFVRDILLGVKNLDVDIVIEGDALKFVRLLQKEIKFDLKAHKRFGTATISLPSGFKIDVASARKEHYVHPGSLPRVYLSFIRDDLFRRDFTINALAIKISRNNLDRILDLFDGLKDLREGKIRILHDGSFIDDPTRIMRAVRFEQRYGFSIEKHTERLIREASKSGMLKRLSRFRIGDEIILILKEEDPLRPLVRLGALCGLEFIHPAIRLNKTVSRQFKAAKTFIHLFRKMRPDEIIDNWLIYFIILTSRLSAKQIKRLSREFSLTKSCEQKLDSFKKNAPAALKAIGKRQKMSASRVYRILRPFSYEEVLVLLCLAKTKIAKSRIELFLKKLSRIKIGIGGRDLQRLKLKPGPGYKKILQNVLYEKVDGRLKTRTDELNYVRRLLK